MRRSYSPYHYLLILVLFMASSCSQQEKVKPQKGYIDLSKGDIFNTGAFSLDGEWEFYWDQLLSPSDFKTNNLPETRYIKVYGSWTAQKDAEGNNYPAYGYATYRLIIKTPIEAKDLGIYIPKIWSASKVWVNGQLISNPGKVGKDRAHYDNKMVEELSPISVTGGQIEIIAQVANHDHFLAGIVSSFRVGKYQNIYQEEALTSSWNLMWLGCLFIMGLYHFVIFIFRKKFISPLYFGMICLLIGLRLLVFGDHELYIYLKHHWGFLTFYLQSRVYYISTMALGPMGLAYLKSLYPDIGNRPINKKFTGFTNQKVLRISSIFSAVLSVIALLTPTHLLSLFIPMAMPLAIGIPLIFGIVILIKAIIAKKPEINFQLIGIGAMLIMGINDGLHTVGIFVFSEGELLPLGFAIFLSLQFVLLSKRFSNAFKSVEDLSANLEKKVIERTHEVTQQKEELETQRDAIADKNGQLETLLTNINHSIKYASRIQQAILGSKSSIIKRIQNFGINQDSFIFFKPRDIVSGDFYWYEEVQGARGEIYQVIVAADCTGHGVPGAFMTVMGTDFLTNIINESKVIQPCQVLEELDQRVTSILHKQSDSATNDGMDMSMIVFDKSTFTLAFAGAKNPLYWTNKLDSDATEMNIIKGDKYPIGGHTDKKKSFHTEKIEVKPGDTFYLFSDGYMDQFGGPSNRKFMKKKFRELLFANRQLSMNEQHDALDKAFKEWKGDNNQTDDVLVMGISF